MNDKEFAGIQALIAGGQTIKKACGSPARVKAFMRFKKKIEGGAIPLRSKKQNEKNLEGEFLPVQEQIKLMEKEAILVCRRNIENPHFLKIAIEIIKARIPEYKEKSVKRQLTPEDYIKHLAEMGIVPTTPDQRRRRDEGEGNKDDLPGQVGSF